MDETISLGGNIDLVGFRDMDRDTMVIVRKMVGQSARKMSELNDKFERLTVTMKPVHEKGDSKKYELHGKLLAAGKPVVSETTERNLFVGLNKILENIMKSVKS